MAAAPPAVCSALVKAHGLAQDPLRLLEDPVVVRRAGEPAQVLQSPGAVQVQETRLPTRRPRWQACSWRRCRRSAGSPYRVQAQGRPSGFHCHWPAACAPPPPGPRRPCVHDGNLPRSFVRRADEHLGHGATAVRLCRPAARQPMISLDTKENDSPRPVLSLSQCAKMRERRRTSPLPRAWLAGELGRYLEAGDVVLRHSVGAVRVGQRCGPRVSRIVSASRSSPIEDGGVALGRRAAWTVCGRWPAEARGAGRSGLSRTVWTGICQSHPTGWHDQHRTQDCCRKKTSHVDPPSIRVLVSSTDASYSSWRCTSSALPLHGSHLMRTLHSLLRPKESQGVRTACKRASQQCSLLPTGSVRALTPWQLSSRLLGTLRAGTRGSSSLSLVLRRRDALSCPHGRRGTSCNHSPY